MMEVLGFNDGWMEKEPLHRIVVDVTAQVIHEWGGSPNYTETASDMMYHFMSHWYSQFKDNGQLIIPAVRSCSFFTIHMIEEHGLPRESALVCLDMLTRFCALVITRAGGKLI